MIVFWPWKLLILLTDQQMSIYLRQNPLQHETV